MMTDPPPPNANQQPLSASTPAFRPSEDQDSTLGASSSLWGAIGQSFSFSGQNSSTHTASSSGNGGATSSGIGSSNYVGARQEPGLDLWNFGGFDVDALTGDDKEKSKHGYRNESRLSSAFGNLDIGRGVQGRYDGQDDYYGRGAGGGYDGIPRWTGQGSYGYQQYGEDRGELVLVVDIDVLYLPTSNLASN